MFDPNQKYYLCGGNYGEGTDRHFALVTPSGSDVPYIFTSPREALSCSHHSALFEVVYNEIDGVYRLNGVDDKRFDMNGIKSYRSKDKAIFAQIEKAFGPEFENWIAEKTTDDIER